MADEPIEIEGDDPDDAYCEGDTPPEDIDWDKVEQLDAVEKRIQEVSDGDEVTATLLSAAVLHEAYGEDLEVHL